MSATRFVVPHALLRSLVNHNPFYVVSAALVLFGLHTSFTGSIDPTRGSVMMGLYCGYMAVLAMVAYVVIRFGQVWEDARTILLIIVLLVAALSNSLDGFVMSNPGLGIFYLGGGLLFAIVLTESVLAALKMRLPARYRLPFYLQLLLLFAYPAILSELLVIHENKAAMRMCVLLFPVLAGLTVLCLVPAARGKPSREPLNGTPWRWPLYPWPLFVITTVALALRSYSLSLSFEVADGLETGFDWYFLFPILMAAVVVLIELSIAGGSHKTRRSLILLPLVLLVLALPGESVNEAQTRFLTALQDHGGSPIQIALMVAGLFYLMHTLRATPRAELGLCLCLATASVVNVQTLGVTTMVFPQTAGVLLLSATLLAAGAARRSSLRILAGGVLALAVPALESDALRNWSYGFFAMCAMVSLLSAVGMVFSDRLSTALKRHLPAALAVAALLAAVTWPFVLTRVAPVQQHLGLAIVTALAALYWLRSKRAKDLLAVATTTIALAVCPSLHLVIQLQDRQVLKGIQFLAWGLLFLLVALAVSLIKGGLVERLRLWLDVVNQAAQGSRKGDELSE